MSHDRYLLARIDVAIGVDVSLSSENCALSAYSYGTRKSTPSGSHIGSRQRSFEPSA